MTAERMRAITREVRHTAAQLSHILAYDGVKA